MHRTRIARVAGVASLMLGTLVGAACLAVVAASPPTSPAAPSSPGAASSPGGFTMAEFGVPPGTHPHDVSPAADGGIWYTGQHSGTLGHLDPVTGEIEEIDLGDGARPHGVITGPDGAPWITDGGLDAIVRVDPATGEVRTFPMPADLRDANLNTATFDGDGVLWFTGQSGMYGRLDAAGGGQVEAFGAPRGRGPYGIATTPDGEVWYVSLGGSYLAHVERATGQAIVLEPPTPGQGARRVWSDPQGRLFVAEWNAAQVGMYDPVADAWREWTVPGEQRSQPYAVYVDEAGIVWLTDFGNNAIVRFDPATEVFTPLALPTPDAAVRQLHGRPGEVWGAESGADRLVVVRTG
jgi:virginiamycin B lyase